MVLLCCMQACRNIKFLFHSNEIDSITLGHKFINAAHTVTILSISDVSLPALHFSVETGSVDCRMVYLFLSSPIILSIWILTFESR